MATQTNATDLDCMAPEQCPAALRKAAGKYRESAAELQAAGQDKHAGHVWLELASVLESAAEHADRMVRHWG